MELLYREKVNDEDEKSESDRKQATKDGYRET